MSIVRTFATAVLRALRKFKNRTSLTNEGERVDIWDRENHIAHGSNLYQISHLKRYGFASNLMNPEDVVGDFACGTGYGSSMLSRHSSRVLGIDIDNKVIEVIRERYRENKKIEFFASDILDIKYKDYFDKVVSFETIEHLEERDIPTVFAIFYRALKCNGKLIFSVPYLQEASEKAIKKGFHKTFNIDEQKLHFWLNSAGFGHRMFRYQNYFTHEVCEDLAHKDFIICIASKQNE